MQKRERERERFLIQVQCVFWVNRKVLNTTLTVVFFQIVNYFNYISNQSFNFN